MSFLLPKHFLNLILRSWFFFKRNVNDYIFFCCKWLPAVNNFDFERNPPSPTKRIDSPHLCLIRTVVFTWHEVDQALFSLKIFFWLLKDSFVFNALIDVGISVANYSTFPQAAATSPTLLDFVIRNNQVNWKVLNAPLHSTGCTECDLALFIDFGMVAIFFMGNTMKLSALI